MRTIFKRTVEQVKETRSPGVGCSFISWLSPKVAILHQLVRVKLGSDLEGGGRVSCSRCTCAFDPMLSFQEEREAW